jgi:phosphatidylinositol alpha-1,6-mannosyltransferase
VILTVGRLQRRKGQDTAIRSLPDLIRRFPDLLYAIVGEGEDLGHLEATVESLHLQDHVMLMGKLDDDELMRCYQQCDLFLLPNRAVGSDIEGFGMVLLEAQSCARPVLAGKSGETREALVDGKTGWLVSCETSEALSRSLGEVLGDPDLLKTMGDAGREWVVKNFDWDSLQAQANVLFRDLSR